MKALEKSSIPANGDLDALELVPDEQTAIC